MDESGKEPRSPIDLVCVGEVLIDLVASDADVLGEAITFVRAAGGSPANVAMAASRLGASTAFVGAVGSDHFGAYLRHALVENGIDVSHLRSVPERTTLALVAKNQGGLPDFVFYRAADATLRPEQIPRAMLRDAGIVFVSSMALMSEPSRSATLRVVALAREGHGLVAVDPNLRPSNWPSLGSLIGAVSEVIGAADILKVNDEEARLLTGKETAEEALPSLGRPNALVVITRGDQGSLWRWKEETGSVSAVEVEIVDTTGAGDAFMGGLLAELTTRGLVGACFGNLDRFAVESIITFATKVAALSCTKLGAMTSLPTREDVGRRFESR